MAALAAALVAGGGAEAPAPEADAARAGAALAAVQARYDGVRDFRADFSQTSFSAALGDETRASGRVVMRRPGHMRWQYAPPDERVIVVDGETIRLYSPEDRQLQIAPLGEGAVSPMALSFLLGEGVLSETFSARLLAERRDAPTGERSELGLELRPRGEQGFQTLELWVDAQSFELRESLVVDFFGNRTSLRFANVVENGGVDDAAFTLEVPADTAVIDLR